MSRTRCASSPQARRVLDKTSDPAPSPPTCSTDLSYYMYPGPASEDGSLTEVPSIEFYKGRVFNVCIWTPGNSSFKADEERLKDPLPSPVSAVKESGLPREAERVLAKPPAGVVQRTKTQQAALRTNENIQGHDRDLFHSPPIYKATISPLRSSRDRCKERSGGQDPQCPQGRREAEAEQPAALEED